MIVKIAIKNLNFQADKLYSYIVPKNLENNVKIGQIVIVPFGKYNKKQQGFILEICENITCEIDVNKLKEIISILENNLNISEEMIKLIKYLKETCFCTYYEACRTVIPEFMSEKLSNIKYILNKNIIYNNFNLTNEEINFIKNFENKKQICISTIKKLKIKNYNNILKLLLEKKIITEKLSISKTKNKKTEKILDNKEKINININLSQEQEKVYNNILNYYKQNEYNINLIHGVTGSGKTQILLKLIEYVLNNNKSIIYLVPEIALTSQFLELFKLKFNNKICLIHSAMSKNEKFEIWEKIQNNQAQVILGPRSAIFAPVFNLGLIIIDEEHDSAYKSDSNPKFHTHDIAKFRCKNHNCTLILASATPKLESYYQAKNKNYILNTLKTRYKNSVLPDTKIINLNNNNEYITNSVFSKTFLDLLTKNIENSNQSIILINRRGYNTFVKCSNCNETQMCPYCSVSLVYHKINNKLTCHYCNYTKKISENCMFCNKNSLYYLGFGTEKVESQLSEFIPEAKILRIDSDICENKNSLFKEKLKSFEENKYNILIGTQMISKGFNFPKVTLVGILNADQSLFESNFKSYEKTFSLITQTIGRAGRYDLPGQAIIQTFSPDNKILKLAASQDYENFYQDEIKLRKIMLNPPFSDICVILFKSKNENKVINSCNIFFENIKNIAKNKYQDIPLRILPPTPAIIKKISENYRYKIIIKCKNNKKFRDMIREIILNSNLNNISISIDINPSNIL